MRVQRSLALICVSMLGAVAACGSGDVAVIVEQAGDERNKLRPLHADADGLYYTRDGCGGGIFYLAFGSGTTPLAELGCGRVRHAQRSGDSLLVIVRHRDSPDALMVVPLDGSPVRSTNMATRRATAATRVDGETYVLHDSQISRLRDDGGFEPALAELGPYDTRDSLVAHGGYLHWLENGQVLRVALDGSTPVPEPLPFSFDVTGDEPRYETKILGAYRGEILVASMLFDSYTINETVESGTVVHELRGGAIHTASTDGGRIYAQDIVAGGLDGDVVLGVDTELGAVHLDLPSGAVTPMGGRISDFFQTQHFHAADGTLYYARFGSRRHSIESISAPR